MRGQAIALAGLLVAASAAPASLPLPGGEGGIGLDDLQFSRELGRVVVPAGRTGRLDLVDPRTRSIESVQGFGRTESSTRGHEDGTTSADVGGGFVFAIDRTDRILAAVDPRALRIVAQTKLGGGPDYVRWVESTREVWVTEPGREAIEIFRFERAPTPSFASTGMIRIPGGPESLVVDSGGGRAYTNTFREHTLAVDVRSRAVTARWTNGCLRARGIALDAARGLVFVGCDEGKAVALDSAHGGKMVGSVSTGGGVDSIAYGSRLSHLYVPAGDAATLSIIGVGEAGRLQALGTAPAASGTHCVATDDQGNVFLCDPRGGRVLLVADPFSSSR